MNATTIELAIWMVCGFVIGFCAILNFWLMQRTREERRKLEQLEQRLQKANEPPPDYKRFDYRNLRLIQHGQFLRIMLDLGTPETAVVTYDNCVQALQQNCSFGFHPTESVAPGEADATISVTKH